MGLLGGGEDVVGLAVREQTERLGRVVADPDPGRSRGTGSNGETDMWCRMYSVYLNAQQLVHMVDTCAATGTHGRHVHSNWYTW